MQCKQDLNLLVICYCSTLDLMMRSHYSLMINHFLLFLLYVLTVYYDNKMMINSHWTLSHNKNKSIGIIFRSVMSFSIFCLFGLLNLFLCFNILFILQWFLVIWSSDHGYLQCSGYKTTWHDPRLSITQINICFYFWPRLLFGSVRQE